MPAPKLAQPKPALPTPPVVQQPQTLIPSVPLKRKQVPLTKIDIQTWEDETLTQIFKVTLKVHAVLQLLVRDISQPVAFGSRAQRL